MPSFATHAPRCIFANLGTGDSIACLVTPRPVVRPEPVQAGAGAPLALDDVWERVQARAEVGTR